MSDLNRVQLLGRVGARPELKTGKSGHEWTEVAVATNTVVPGVDGAPPEERTEWHRVKFFGRTAVNCAEHLDKGRDVYVEGRLQMRKWTDKDGQDRFEREVVGRRIDFIGSKRAA